MMQNIHELRRHEEGQALVLAAISMLILALCVLATINLTFAVDQKEKLQNAADAAAYTTAAYEARTLNFLAYTNRAMIVQYAAQMNLMAMTTYLYFNLALWTGLNATLSAIPILGEIVMILYYLWIGLATFFYIVAEAAVPLIDGLNYGQSLAQYAVVQSISSPQSSASPIVLNGPVSEIQGPSPNGNLQTNPDYTLTNLAPGLLGVNDEIRWGTNSANVGSMVQVSPMNPNFVPVVAGQAGYDRLVMVEMVNAARHSFTAYGGPNGGNILSWLVPPKIPRQAQWTSPYIGIPGILGFQLYLGKSARTEWGALTSGARNPGGAIGGVINSLLKGDLTPTEEIFSLDRFQITVQANVPGISINVGIGLDSYAYADRGTPIDSIVYGIESLLGLSPSYVYSHNVVPTFTNQVNSTAPFPFSLLTKPLAKLIQGLFTGLFGGYVAAVDGVLKDGFFPPPIIPFFHFGMVPYARFRPIPQPGGVALATRPSATQLFNQPPVLMMVTIPAASLRRLGQPFTGETTGWGFQLGSLTAGGSPGDPNYDLGRNRAASKEGYVTHLSFNTGAQNDIGLPMPATMDGGGMAAIGAAMAYYHRPGDWREPPNLFNPMWGAKLMPAVDYPTLAQQGGAFDTLVANNLIVH